MFQFIKQNNIKIVYFFIIIIFILILVIYSINVNNYIFNNQFGSNYIYILNLNNNSKCDPIYLNKENFKIFLNGSNYPKSIPLSFNDSINFDCLNTRSSNVKRILLWNTFFGDSSYGFGLGVKEPFINNYCPVVNCELTNDKSKLNESSFVLVHMRDSFEPIPTNRLIEQRWIFVLLESPMHAAEFYSYDSKFNMTLTYRIESDFPVLTGAYKLFKWAENKSFDLNKNFSNTKTDFAAAVISNCAGSSKRLEYIKEMQKYVQVDLFGSCGKTCQSKFKQLKSENDCKMLISNSYKFYLAFENSVCNGYITEKFFQVLKYDIIPVVLGGGDYSYYVPKSGYINVNDFSSPKKLAEYLLYLDRNHTEYNSYFKWKRYVSFLDRFQLSPFCDLCINLHLEDFYGLKKNVVTNLGDFWSKSVNCKIPKFDSDMNFLI